MGDVVPERERGRYFGLRTGVMGVVGMAANLAAGCVPRPAWRPVSFQVVLVVAVAVALVGVAIYLAQVDPPTPTSASAWASRSSAAGATSASGASCASPFYWNFVVMLSGPFVTPYLLQELGFTFTHGGDRVVDHRAHGARSPPTCGAGGRPLGPQAVLSLGTFLVGLLLPAGWILAGITGVTAWIWATAVFDAVSWGPVRPAAFNLALRRRPARTGWPSSPCTGSGRRRRLPGRCGVGAAAARPDAARGDAVARPLGRVHRALRDRGRRAPAGMVVPAPAGLAAVATAAARPQGSTARHPAGVTRWVTRTSCGSSGRRSTTHASIATATRGARRGRIGSRPS
jgi:hypothetical protein